MILEKNVFKGVIVRSNSSYPDGRVSELPPTISRPSRSTSLGYPDIHIRRSPSIWSSKSKRQLLWEVRMDLDLRVQLTNRLFESAMDSRSSDGEAPCHCFLIQPQHRMQFGDTKRREPRISPIKGRATRVALNPGARSDRIIVGDRGTRQQKRPSHLVFEKKRRRVVPYYMHLSCIR